VIGPSIEVDVGDFSALSNRTPFFWSSFTAERTFFTRNVW
jgi:hypothetical protein